MNTLENNVMFDLGSAPVSEDFDPFAFEEELDGSAGKTDIQQMQKEESVQKHDPVTGHTERKTAAGNLSAEPAPASDTTFAAGTPKTPGALKSANVSQKTGIRGTEEAETKEMKTAEPEQGFAGKPPVFAYAGALEQISDVSMTFEELRIEKAGDFPELEDGKRVSWTVEYGKITKAVSDPKGTSIGKMKAEIETSKEFLASLKRAKDKSPVCKIKPRITAQSKGTASAYKGIFTTMEEAEAAGKVISIVPSRDGKVYEIRDTEMGKFITPAAGCEMLSEVQAGFTPALPRIPVEILLEALAFFRHFIRYGSGKEALLNIYWDKEAQAFLADAPEQVVSRFSVKSKISGKFADERYIHYMDIHSHNTMKAFFSAVDDHDEKATRLYTVVGRLDQPVPEIRTRISNGGKFMDIDPSHVFELPDASFPDVWTESVDMDTLDSRKARGNQSRMEKRERRMERKMEKRERKAERKMERKMRKAAGAI